MNLEQRIVAGALGLFLLAGTPQRVESREICQPGVSVGYDSNSARMKWDSHELMIRVSDGKVQYRIDNQRFKNITFKDEEDLNRKIGKSLDHEIGHRRKKIGGCFSDIYDKLNLERYNLRSRVNSTNERKVSDFILNAKAGPHTLEERGMPLTYLLVRHENTSAFYCLSLAQEVFDMIYGLGEAKRAGLYSAKFAEDLDFSGRPVKVEKYSGDKHQDLKRGSIVRYNRGLGSLRSIGISLGKGKIAHIIGDTVYVSKIGYIMDEGWTPKEIIMPDASFKERSLNPKEAKAAYFRKGTTLERIGPAVKKKFGLNGNDAAIEETIYQLNKSSFNIGHTPSQTTALLRKDTSLILPSYWLR